ncbi:MAG: hypothetical protein A2015_00765 [Spirochaetes bacterium GWF1_31_7]|nr:MAG: hypothetical protein A2Y30_12630 [Spirochaetes bacterium GWE1_32_154]OHD51654.1 MAG: hypothetical protein A2Y29_04430 [Spirochaetes bacterium GWE2_31_10]OHD51907.1 MAG: hypothetical protein A2015_00765 [Spirochaetes bacterium GWF1_31_7]HBD93783.1 hypothetical protein [Spirochaetia bacterium]
MDKSNAMEELNDLKKIMKSTSNKAMKSSGWFFILWGSIWIIGFSVGQFFNNFNIVWSILNIFGIITSIFLSKVLYGKNNKFIFPKILFKIFLISVGVIIFDIIIIWMFNLKTIQNITLLIILSTALCYFIIGVFNNNLLIILAILLVFFCIIGYIFFIKYLYLFAGVSCGSSLILTGVLILNKNETR